MLRTTFCIYLYCWPYSRISLRRQTLSGFFLELPDDCNNLILFPMRADRYCGLGQWAI